ncbi:MAG: gamma-glutamylcyclotransferase family protein [Cyanobacteria bacterium J06554_6]
MTRVFARVFVYGTLKPGGQYHDEYCGRYLVKAEGAIARGQLYDFPQLGYPGMTAGDGWVQGYLLSFSSHAVLEKLDWLEDYDPQASPEENEYVRHQASIWTLDGRPLGMAWVYLMDTLRVQALGGVHLVNGVWPLP